MGEQDGIRLDLRQRARELHRRFQIIRSTTESLCANLSAEDCALQSMPDASPVKWHLAHTSWFFETFVLTPGLADYQPPHAHYKVLFNSYYVAVGERHPRPERGLLSRPSLSEVLDYRHHVDRSIARWIDRCADVGALQIFELGLNHEQQHQELILTDLKHLFSRNPLKPAYCARIEPARSQVATTHWIAYAAGLREMGWGGTGFAFDNESPRHRHYLRAFELASHLVTNRDYRAFIDDGGYRRPELWLSEGWDARGNGNWRAPLYWQLDGNGSQFTLSGVCAVDGDEPVCHVSFYEADAYARWANARLPTEAEWETAACELEINGNFSDAGFYSPIADHARSDALRPRQMFGDVWEWTRSDYAPYPGFRPAAGAVGEYNGKFMCNQYVLRGGSCATPESHIRASYRNFFPADARWQFSGVRLARDV